MVKDPFTRAFAECADITVEQYIDRVKSEDLFSVTSTRQQKIKVENKVRIYDDTIVSTWHKF